jgi:hypothetical protein
VICIRNSWTEFASGFSDALSGNRVRVIRKVEKSNGLTLHI